MCDTHGSLYAALLFSSSHPRDLFLRPPLLHSTASLLPTKAEPLSLDARPRSSAVFVVSLFLSRNPQSFSGCAGETFSSSVSNPDVHCLAIPLAFPRSDAMRLISRRTGKCGYAALTDAKGLRDSSRMHMHACTYVHVCKRSVTDATARWRNEPRLLCVRRWKRLKPASRLERIRRRECWTIEKAVW